MSEKAKIVYIAIDSQNQIRERELVRETDEFWEIKPLTYWSSNEMSLFEKDFDRNAQVCSTQQEANKWLEARRKERIDDAKKELAELREENNYPVLFLPLSGAKDITDYKLRKI